MTGEFPDDPLDVVYADYLTTFMKKLELTSIHSNRLKRFIMFNSMKSLNHLAYYMIDREKGYGCEDFYKKDDRKVPACLKNYPDLVYADGE